MAWLWWRQHRADYAEVRAMRTYLRRRAGHRAFCECVIGASRRADAMVRLNAALDQLQDVRVTFDPGAGGGDVAMLTKRCDPAPSAV